MVDILGKNILEIDNGTLTIYGKTYKIEEFDFLIPEELQTYGALGGMDREKGILKYKGVPEKFLPYALYHESICGFIDGRGKCVHSIDKELELVPEDIKKEYIKWRIGFFEGMCNYAKNSQQEKLLEEMKASLEYIRSLGNNGINDKIDLIKGKVCDI